MDLASSHVVCKTKKSYWPFHSHSCVKKRQPNKGEGETFRLPPSPVRPLFPLSSVSTAFIAHDLLSIDRLIDPPVAWVVKWVCYSYRCCHEETGTPAPRRRRCSGAGGAASTPPPRALSSPRTSRGNTAAPTSSTACTYYLFSCSPIRAVRSWTIDLVLRHAMGIPLPPFFWVHFHWLNELCVCHMVCRNKISCVDWFWGLGGTSFSGKILGHCGDLSSPQAGRRMFFYWVLETLGIVSVSSNPMASEEIPIVPQSSCAFIDQIDGEKPCREGGLVRCISWWWSWFQMHIEGRANGFRKSSAQGVVLKSNCR